MLGFSDFLIRSKLSSMPVLLASIYLWHPNSLLYIFFSQLLPQSFRSTFYKNPLLHNTLSYGSLLVFICGGKRSVSWKRTLAWLTNTLSSEFHLKMANPGSGKSWCLFNFHKRMLRLLTAQVIMSLMRNKERSENFYQSSSHWFAVQLLLKALLR